MKDKYNYFAAPTTWIGGKALMLDEILPLIPEHQYYCEVFGGGGALLFAKPRAEVEIYNDKDDMLVNFFRVLRDLETRERFLEMLNLTPFAQSEWQLARQVIKERPPDADRVLLAWAFYVLINQSFSSTGSSFAVNLKHHNRYSRSWFSRIAVLPEFARRLSGVEVRNLDWRKCVKNYERAWKEKGLFYLDPPYLPITRKEKKIYACEMTADEHQELIDWCLQTKCKVILSGYPSEMYEALEKAGWDTKTRETHAWLVGFTRNSSKINYKLDDDTIRHERLWWNFDASFDFFGKPVNA